RILARRGHDHGARIGQSATFAARAGSGVCSMGLGDSGDRSAASPSSLRARLTTAMRRPRRRPPATAAPSRPMTGRPMLPGSPLVSVVVPVYEGEGHLAECLESLLGQSYRRIQVVVVDD